MNYATWKINFTDPNYGTGPEDRITAQGFHAEGSWVNGQAENGGTILGYVTGEPVASALTTWEYTSITQEQALEFAQAINSKAYLLEDGRITAPFDETALLPNTP
jgi:hypothetical protein